MPTMLGKWHRRAKSEASPHALDWLTQGWERGTPIHPGTPIQKKNLYLVNSCLAESETYCRASHTGDAGRGERERGMSSELANMTC